MILFFKHILRSIKRRPLQPILILLTLTLAVSVAVTAFRFRDVFLLQADANEERYAASGDILITPTKNSTIRMLFEEDAESIVKDRGEWIGEYALTFFKNDISAKRIVKGAALDLAAADRYFDFTYTEYGRFTTTNLTQSAIVSLNFAKQYDLCVGDRLELELFGDDVSFTIQAIAQPTGLLSQRDILIQTQAVLQILGRHIPAIGSLGDAFAPCTRLMIRCEDPNLIQELANELQNSDAFSGYLVEVPYEQSQKDFFVAFQTLLVSVLAVLILVLCGLLITACLQLLQMQRKEEYALFALAGADHGQLCLLLYCESMLYGLAGAVLGMILAIPMLDFAGGLFRFSRQTVSVGRGGFLFGFLFSFLLIFVCTFLQIRRSNYKQEATNNEKSRTALYGFLIGILILSICFSFLPNKWRYIPAFGAVFLFIFLLYFASSFVLKWFAIGLQALLSKCKTAPACQILASKSLENNPSLRSIVRPFAVLFAMVITIGVCYQSVYSQKQLIENALLGEVACINLPPESKQEIQEASLVEGIATYSFISNVKMPLGYSAIAIACAGDLALCSNPDLIPSPIPQNNEVVLSKGLAYLFSKDVGDSIEIHLQGVATRFTVVGIQPINSNFIFLSADAIESSTEITVFKLPDNENAIRDLITKLDSEGVSQIEKADIFGSIPGTIGAFLHLCLAVVAISALISLLGCTTLLYQQYHLRANERRILQQSGATRDTVCKIHCLEIGYILLISLLLAVLFGTAMAFAIDQGLLSFGMSLFT